MHAMVHAHVLHAMVHAHVHAMCIQYVHSRAACGLVILSE